MKRTKRKKNDYPWDTERYPYRQTAPYPQFTWKEHVFNGGFIKLVVYFLIGIFLLIGQVKCFNKMVTSDWEPIGKREVIYTASFFTCLGGIVGWFEIN